MMSSKGEIPMASFRELTLDEMDSVSGGEDYATYDWDQRGGYDWFTGSPQGGTHGASYHVFTEISLESYLNSVVASNSAWLDSQPTTSFSLGSVDFGFAPSTSQNGTQGSFQNVNWYGTARSVLNDVFGTGPHDYDAGGNVLCWKAYTPQCNIDTVWADYKQTPALGVFDPAGVVNGQINEIPGVGLIQTFVDDVHHTITNVTLANNTDGSPNHILTGVVVRSLIETGGAFLSSSRGYSADPTATAPWLNNTIATPIWAMTDAVIQGRIAR